MLVEELLIEAKKKYPLGSVIRSLGDNKQYIVDIDPYFYDTKYLNIAGSTKECVLCYGSRNPIVWAEIVSTPKTNLKIGDLIEGEIYWCKGVSTHLFKFTRELLPQILNDSSFYQASALDVSYCNPLRTTTEEEKAWLNECIKANKFIPKEEALKVNEGMFKKEEIEEYDRLGRPFDINTLKKVKEEVEFVVGKWYKYVNWYIKLGEVTSNGAFIASETINPEGRYTNQRGLDFRCGNANKEKLLVTNLAEIQQYLPERHIDRFDTAVSKPVEKWSVGTYVLMLVNNPLACNYKKGEIVEIIKITSGQVMFENRTTLCKSHEEKGFIKWFATKEEAEMYLNTSCSSININNIKPIPSYNWQGTDLEQYFIKEPKNKKIQIYTEPQPVIKSEEDIILKIRKINKIKI